MPIHEGYGLTEASPRFDGEPRTARRKERGVGVAVPEVEIQIDAPGERRNRRGDRARTECDAGVFEQSDGER